MIVDSDSDPDSERNRDLDLECDTHRVHANQRLKIPATLGVNFVLLYMSAALRMTSAWVG